MISACDKLHKLYSSTSQPVVWARSVGLEVLNELDTIKAALMMSAGSERHSRRPGEVGWELAAKSIENFATGLDNARALGGSLANVVGDGVRSLWERGGSGRA